MPRRIRTAHRQTYIKVSIPKVGLNQISLLERDGLFTLIMMCDHHVDIVGYDTPDFGILREQTCEMETNEDLHRKLRCGVKNIRIAS